MRRMNTAAAPAAPEYDPISAFGWQYLYWAEGPAFEAQGYGHLSTVSTWPDEMGNANMNASGTPTRYDGIAQLNSKPCVDINGGDVFSQVGYSSHGTYSIVWIGKLNASGTNRWMDNQLSGGRVIPMVPYTSNWQIYFGSAAGQSVAVGSIAGAHGTVTVNNGSSDEGWVGGSRVYGPTQYGGDNVNGMQWTGASGGVILGFFGVWTGGNITNDAGWPDFQAWALDHYGVSI